MPEQPPAALPIRKTSMSGLVHVIGPSGHRAEYQTLFAARLDLRPVSGRVSWWTLRPLVGAERMLFATIDDDLVGYALVAVLRALRGRRTAGLFLRPHACLQPGRKALIKRTAFRLLRRVPGVTTLSILPTDLFPAQATVVSGWVHDPQLWDLHDCPDDPDPTMQETLRDLAGGRRVLAFLGQVAPIKGFPLLAAMVEARPDLARQFCIVVAGEVTEPCRAAAERLERHGITLWPRRISESEMTAIYRGADLVWACYDPSYDQASGIFGRAVQRGRMAVIREGSMLENYALMLCQPVLALPYDATEAARHLAEVTIRPTPPAILIAEWSRQSMATIRAAVW